LHQSTIHSVDRKLANSQDVFHFAMAWAMFVLVLLCVFIYKFCKTMRQHLQMYKTASSIPGPKEFTLIGVVFKVSGVDAMFDYLMKLTDVFGEVLVRTCESCCVD
jgi:hypothetical protein